MGGYHPVHLQDEYSDGRYRIVHKLGFGTYSTVWLAKDQHMNRYVVLKIVVAEASKSSSEGRILRHLANSQNNHAGRSYVSLIFDEFCIDGPNGRHRCLVSEPARCSIAASKEASTNGCSQWRLHGQSPRRPYWDYKTFTPVVWSMAVSETDKSCQRLR